MAEDVDDIIVGIPAVPYVEDHTLYLTFSGAQFTNPGFYTVSPNTECASGCGN